MCRKSLPFKFLALTLLFVFVSVQSPLHELLKLPELISHYKEHKSENKSISFIKFLEDHYLKSLSTKDNKHSKLPFKDEAHPLMLGLNYIASSEKIVFEVQHYPIRINNRVEESGPSQGQETGIWQPPKI